MTHVLVLLGIVVVAAVAASVGAYAASKAGAIAFHYVERKGTKK